MGKVRVDKRCRLHFRARETTKPETSTVISSEADKTVPLPREVMEGLPVLSLEDKKTAAVSLKKKDRRKLRHSSWLKKIDVYQKAKEKAKATEERQKTAVVGDIHPLMEALPSLELEYVDKTSGKPSSKRPHRAVVKEMVHFHEVLKHPAYIKDPLKTIALHIENSVAQGLT
ncbi:ribosome biogenesis protein SLX9 homolog [Halichondria panicea]|uniref:ribosome biogenesis protein SLX9 homolog n=1 Tax=Halichondria panicea TaxID=6063 RepID=UPI00312B6EDF